MGTYYIHVLFQAKRINSISLQHGYDADRFAHAVGSEQERDSIWLKGSLAAKAGSLP
ncbi:protein of unknown function [Pseudorhizobium banfieldiae]|uniref:Uncharacterized protein n=1 Tax=Pseudorhizobium banfieldiae TaxID=1125847 RepID=L0NDZ3_9HYPH|nr:protein of unknown function [Pseudorhizobium banfieldiae]